MNNEILLNQLIELAGKLEISVREENLNTEESSSAGGLCRVEGKYILMLNSKSPLKEKNRVMIRALQQFDLHEIYIKPAVRALLEEDEEL
jgi:hypothetical protein